MRVLCLVFLLCGNLPGEGAAQQIPDHTLPLSLHSLVPEIEPSALEAALGAIRPSLDCDTSTTFSWIDAPPPGYGEWLSGTPVRGRIRIEPREGFQGIDLWMPAALIIEGTARPGTTDAAPVDLRLPVGFFCGGHGSCIHRDPMPSACTDLRDRAQSVCIATHCKDTSPKPAACIADIRGRPVESCLRDSCFEGLDFADVSVVMRQIDGKTPPDGTCIKQD